VLGSGGFHSVNLCIQSYSFLPFSEQNSFVIIDVRVRFFVRVSLGFAGNRWAFPVRRVTFCFLLDFINLPDFLLRVSFPFLFLFLCAIVSYRYRHY